jgi:hypothetical protein
MLVNVEGSSSPNTFSYPSSARRFIARPTSFALWLDGMCLDFVRRNGYPMCHWNAAILWLDCQALADHPSTNLSHDQTSRKKLFPFRSIYRERSGILRLVFVWIPQLFWYVSPQKHRNFNIIINPPSYDDDNELSFYSLII